MRVKGKKAPLLFVVAALVALFALVVIFVSAKLSGSLSTPSKESNAPTETSAQFTAVGNFDNNANTASVLAKIAQTKSGFSLGLGNYSNDATKTEQEWCNIFKKATSDTYPFQIVAGKNDTPEGSKIMNINHYASCLPNRLGNTVGQYGQQYYFDYNGLARFIMLSPALTIDGHTYNYTKDSPDYIWVQNAINQAKINQTPWIIVGTNKSCISMGESTCQMGSDLLNLLIDKHVDLVLQSGDSAYMRSGLLMNNNQCTNITPTNFNTTA